MPFKKGMKKIAGRKPGSQNKKTVDVKEFFRGLVSDPAWTQKWRDCFLQRPLERVPKHLVELAYHYAYGKPREKIDLGVAEGDLHFTLTIADGFGNKLTMANTNGADHGNGHPSTPISLPPTASV